MITHPKNLKIMGSHYLSHSQHGLLCIPANTIITKIAIEEIHVGLMAIVS